MLEKNDSVQKIKTDGFATIARAPETFRYHKHFRDTIAVQKRQNKVNDDEVHKENANLQNILVAHHSFYAKEACMEKPVLSRPCKSILHDVNCPSRHFCEIVESKRRVTFKDVIVRDYEMTLGDHPDCSYGPPVSIGWGYLEYEPLDINEYEVNHTRRRPLRFLVLNYFKRMHILRVENPNEIKKAVKEVKRVSMRRAITKEFTPFWKIEDVLESFCRKLIRVVKKDLPSAWLPEDELDWSSNSTRSVRSILKR